MMWSRGLLTVCVVVVCCSIGLAYGVSGVVYNTRYGGDSRDTSGAHDDSNTWKRIGNKLEDTKSWFSPNKRRGLIITRPLNKTKIKHYYPAPSDDTVNFTSLFDKQVMQMMLDLQMSIKELKVPFGGRHITFEDICFRPNGGACAVESVFQYWQSSADNLNKTVWDEYHFFIFADYLDHFLSCTREPYLSRDTTRLNMSCLSDYGQPVLPWDVMLGFDGYNYQNSTAFVINFYIDGGVDRDLQTVWEADYIRFLDSYSHPNFTVKHVPENMGGDNIIAKKKTDVTKDGQRGSMRGEEMKSTTFTGSDESSSRRRKENVSSRDMGRLRSMLLKWPDLERGEPMSYS